MLSGASREILRAAAVVGEQAARELAALVVASGGAHEHAHHAPDGVLALAQVLLERPGHRRQHDPARVQLVHRADQ
jgi:hypothetical protein